MTTVNAYPIISSAAFTFNKETGVASTEISNLGQEFRFTRLYNNSADKGFAMRSEKTGKVIAFAVERVETREGDILAWHLTPTVESVLCFPTILHMKVVIFND